MHFTVHALGRGKSAFRPGVWGFSCSADGGASSGGMDGHSRLLTQPWGSGALVTAQQRAQLLNSSTFAVRVVIALFVLLSLATAGIVQPRACL